MSTDREPCRCGAATPIGKWRCAACQARVEAHPERRTPRLRLVDQLEPPDDRPTP